MRIVITDREKTVIEEIIRALQKSGLEYELEGTAQNGQKGYELIESTHPDLIIMDVRLEGMDGLTMLKKLRDKGITSKVLMLTKDTDFNTAREAIELGADSYLLKPLKTEELHRELLKISDRLAEEKAITSVFTVENIFRGCLNGQLHPDSRFHAVTREIYGFTLEEPAAVAAIWLGDRYVELCEIVCPLLEKMGNDSGASVCVLPVDVWHVVTAVLYRFEDEREKVYSFFQSQVIPALCKKIKDEIVCFWGDMKEGGQLLEKLREIQQVREWNLLYDRGKLIPISQIEKKESIPLKYPVELEQRVKRAVLASDGEDIKRCYYRVYDLLRRQPHSPADMKECLIRFNMAVINAYKTQNEIESELKIQACIQNIAEAMSWGQIRTAMEEFLNLVSFKAFTEEGDEQFSPLIRRAVQLVRKYYDQGVTLEETAERLFVSEEYLSSQFKKETGAGFTETVRHYRIERIKGLLLNTRLKLNQIAELTGYTDQKYMSRVFKEEVGVLPSEYRKSVS